MLINREAFLLFLVVFETRFAGVTLEAAAMASSKANSSTQVLRAHHFELVEGMQLQINVTGSSSGRNARIELQRKNCTTTWILHWGYLYRGNVNWFIPVDHPSGTMPYMQGAMQTPFRKNGEVYLLIIELWDPNIHAIEFVLKDGNWDRWLKLNHGNFGIEIPENDAAPSILSNIFSLEKH